MAKKQSTEVTISFKVFTVDRFGYYCNKKDTADLDDFNGYLNELTEWAKDVDTLDSCTYTVKDITQSALFISCIESDVPGRKDKLLTLWQPVPTGAGNTVGALMPKSTSENLVTNIKTFPEGSVPGYPLYYYIIPDERIVAPIKLEGTTPSFTPFKNYMTGFLEWHTGQCVYGKNEKGDTVLKYHVTEEQDISYYPSFTYHKWQKTSAQDRIMQKCNQIKKIIKSDKIYHKRDTNYLQRLATKVFQSNKKRGLGATFKYEVEITPTAEELTAIFDEYNLTHNDSDDAALDYAFQINNKLQWLGHTIQEHTLTKNVRKRDAIFYASQQLLRAIGSQRDDIISEHKKGHQKDNS